VHSAAKRSVHIWYRFYIESQLIHPAGSSTLWKGNLMLEDHLISLRHCPAQDCVYTQILKILISVKRRRCKYQIIKHTRFSWRSLAMCSILRPSAHIVIPSMKPSATSEILIIKRCCALCGSYHFMSQSFVPSGNEFLRLAELTSENHNSACR